VLTSPNVNEKNLLINVCYLNEERDIRKYSRRVSGRESHEMSGRHFIRGMERDLILLQGSQALPACPSDKCNMKVKTLELLGVEA
jgi:hypothetical protein